MHAFGNADHGSKHYFALDEWISKINIYKNKALRNIVISQETLQTPGKSHESGMGCLFDSYLLSLFVILIIVWFITWVTWVLRWFVTGHIPSSLTSDGSLNSFSCLLIRFCYFGFGWVWSLVGFFCLSLNCCLWCNRNHWIFFPFGPRLVFGHICVGSLDLGYGCMQSIFPFLSWFDSSPFLRFSYDDHPGIIYPHNENQTASQMNLEFPTIANCFDAN